MEVGGRAGRKLELPLGVIFDPTDSELIDYLKTKIAGLPIHCDIITEMPYLYEYPPELLPIWKLDYRKKNEAYYFTHKGKKSPPGELFGGKKFDAGEWKIIGPEVEVFVRKKSVGFKTRLNLYRGEKMTGWVIREFRCNPQLLPPDHLQNNTIFTDLIQNYVVLHIKFCPKLRGNFSAEEAFSISVEEAKNLDL